jgi:hypothetical protein
MNQMTGWRPLHELIDEANKHHRKVLAGLRAALLDAKMAGDALNKAKGFLKMHQRRGRLDYRWKKEERRPLVSWMQFVKDHFAGSYETANIYMRIAKRENWLKIQQETLSDRNMTIADAIKILRAKRKEGRKVAAGGILPDPPAEAEDPLAKYTEDELKVMELKGLRKELLKEFETLMERWTLEQIRYLRREGSRVLEKMICVLRKEVVLALTKQGRIAAHAVPHAGYRANEEEE